MLRTFARPIDRSSTHTITKGEPSAKRPKVAMAQFDAIHARKPDHVRPCGPTQPQTIKTSTETTSIGAIVLMIRLARHSESITVISIVPSASALRQARNYARLPIGPSLMASVGAR